MTWSNCILKFSGLAHEFGRYWKEDWKCYTKCNNAVILLQLTQWNRYFSNMFFGSSRVHCVWIQSCSLSLDPVMFIVFGSSHAHGSECCIVFSLTGNSTVFQSHPFVIQWSVLSIVFHCLKFPLFMPFSHDPVIKMLHCLFVVLKILLFSISFCYDPCYLTKYFL